jgi:para-nitrobenzyl esterase
MKILKQAEADGQGFVQKAGVTSIDELRKIPADKVPGGFGMPGGWPIIDGYVIPDDQHILYEAKKYNDVPILVGYNSDEGASFSPPKTPEEYIAATQKRFGKFADDLIRAYPVGTNNVPKTARDLSRDAAFGWQTWAWATLQAKTGKSKVYYYYFDQHLDYADTSKRFGYGSPHGQEVAYVFQHVDASKSDITKTDLAISDAMGTYWTNFAKYGHPNSNDVPVWPAFTNNNPQVMYFNKTAYPGPVPSVTSIQVLDEYFKWRRTAEGKEWAK